MQYLQTVTSKILFLSKREYPDLQEVVSFLTTRVKASDKNYYNFFRVI